MLACTRARVSEIRQSQHPFRSLTRSPPPPPFLSPSLAFPIPLSSHTPFLRPYSRVLFVSLRVSIPSTGDPSSARSRSKHSMRKFSSTMSRHPDTVFYSVFGNISTRMHGDHSTGGASTSPRFMPQQGAKRQRRVRIGHNSNHLL